MDELRRNLLVRYGFALLAVAAVMATMMVPGVGFSTSSLLFLSVFLSSWFGGLGPGLFATAVTVAIGVGMAANGPRPPPLGFSISMTLFLAGGVLICLLVRSMDRARRLAEENAVDAERQSERLRTTLRSIGDAVIVADEEGRVVSLNLVAEALTGWTQAEAQGRRLAEVYHVEGEPGDPTVSDSTERVFEAWGMGGITGRSMLVSRDGTGRPIDETAAAIRGADRSVRGAVLVFRDVSERRDAEEGLRIHRERLDMVLDAAELGVWYGDIPAGTLALNDRARGHHGIGPDDDVTLDRLLAVVHADDRDEVRDCFRRAIAEGDSCDATYRVPGPGGGDRWVRAIGRALRGASGRVARFDGVTIDVTAQKEAEARLREATDGAIEANQAKDKFLAVLGHELRTPLTPVLAAVSSLLDMPGSGRGGADGSSDQVRETLTMIRRNVELETRLIGDLLDVARVQRGQLKLVVEPINLHRALREAVDICRDEVLVSGLDVRLALGAAEHHVEGDHARLLQIAWNLIHNAAKFSPPGGWLTIRTSNESVPGDRDRVVVEFEDNGAGMTAEVLGRIFDAFEQGDTPARHRIGGLGLGLAISRSIAEAHRGTLSAASAGPGLGSTFRLGLGTIPRPARPEPAAISLDGVAPPRVERSVLLVEDNADTLRYLSTLLGQRGYRVATASLLAEAEEAVASSSFDVLISDIELPDGSGLDLMRGLRGKVVGVAVSGFGSDSDVRLSLDAGFAVHLTKPVDFGRLEAAIRDALAVPAS